MAWDDVLVFKLGDNMKGTSTSMSRALHIFLFGYLLLKDCPHSAFMDPSVPDGVPSRVSIEVRAIVLD